MDPNVTYPLGQLGKLEKVDIREIWKRKVKDFTTWLAKGENLTLPSDEIGTTR
jgi:hypothetical protein